LIGRHEPFFCFDRRELWRLAMLGFPLGWVATLASLNVNIPRYFLQHYLGLADQGVYASLAYLVVVINLVVLALTQSVTTRLASLSAEGETKQFLRLLKKLSMLGVLIAAVGVPLTFLVGRPLLTVLYRREYAAHVGLLALFVGVAGVTTIGSFSGIFRGNADCDRWVRAACSTLGPDGRGRGTALFCCKRCPGRPVDDEKGSRHGAPLAMPTRRVAPNSIAFCTLAVYLTPYRISSYTFVCVAEQCERLEPEC
jgi:hypothetical protein